MADTETPKRTRRRDKKPQPIRDWLLYAIIRCLAALSYLMPINAILAMACLFGKLLWRFHRQGRQRAIDSLRASFPEKEDRWIEDIARRSFEQIAMLGVDCLLTPRLAHIHNWKRYARFTTIERVKWMMQEGQGLVMVTGHYGNFEIAGYLLGLFGFKIYSVARALDNLHLDNYIRTIRESKGQTIIDKRGAARLMTQASNDGATLGLIADQDAGYKGIFVEFFGRKASTYKSIALTAITKNMPVVVGYSRRVGNRFFFDIGINRIIFPTEWADQKDPVTWLTAEYTAAIEAFVREDPSQYWWVHRRWKTKPGARRSRKPRNR